MSHVRNHIRIIASLAFAAFFALNCARSAGKTQFSKNMEADAGKPAATYEQWVAAIGQEKNRPTLCGYRPGQPERA